METTTPPVSSFHPTRDAWKTFWTAVGLLVFLHVLIASALAIFFRPSDNHIILRYNVYFGIDLLGAWWQVYLLPLLSLTFLLGNTAFAYRFFKRGEWLLAMLFLLGSAIIAFALSIAVGALVVVNY